MTDVCVNNIKTVSFRDALWQLQMNECAALGIPPFERGTAMTLPDGTEGIHGRLWELISSRNWGSQVFQNDSIHRFAFRTLNGEMMSEDESKLYDLCQNLGAISNEVVVFDVSW